MKKVLILFLMLGACKPKPVVEADVQAGYQPEYLNIVYHDSEVFKEIDALIPEQRLCFNEVNPKKSAMNPNFILFVASRAFENLALIKNGCLQKELNEVPSRHKLHFWLGETVEADTKVSGQPIDVKSAKKYFINLDAFINGRRITVGQMYRKRYFDGYGSVKKTDAYHLSALCQFGHDARDNSKIEFSNICKISGTDPYKDKTAQSFSIQLL